MTMETADTKTFRERIAENPRPAVIWGSVLGVLVLLELGHYAAGALWFGGAIGTALSGIASIPWFVGGNINSVVIDSFESIGVDAEIAAILGVTAGIIAIGITAVILLYIAAAIIHQITDYSLVGQFGVEKGSQISILGREIVITEPVKKRLERIVGAGILAVVTGLLLVPPVAAVVDIILGTMRNAISWVASLPHLTDPSLISNDGYHGPNGWENTFLGLSAALAWFIRVVVVYAYALFLLYWLWRGYKIFKNNYRVADWTPTDDWIRRFSTHSWGIFGFVTIFIFVIMAGWAPSLATYPISHNIYSPFDYHIQYWDGQGVETISHGEANDNTRSDGGESTVGPLSYDQYDRWAPMGTASGGQDLWTFVVYGARTSLIIGLTAIILGGLIALTLSMITAYYKGIVDTLTVVATDTIISIPAFLFALLLLVVFGDANHPIAEPLDGGILLALAFAFVYWPGMWRAIRGPSLQVAEQEWVDAAKSYGQNPFVIMRKHMVPYIAGYLMIYASLLLGSIIIATAALSYLGIGVSHPTAEWGRLISEGEVYINTNSWHVATLPGIMIVLIVTGFNALGDGIRDAIDPESNIESGEDSAVGGGGA